MGTFKISKESTVVADIAFGMGTIQQTRGEQEQFNASHLPYDATKSVKDELDLKETLVNSDAKLATKAELAGSLSQVFRAALAVDANDSVIKSQFDAAIVLLETIVDNDAKLALKADKLNVLELNNTDAFSPVSDYQPATKKFVDDTVTGIGAGDMNKATYDNNDDGYVDSTAGIGKSGELMGISTHDQVMRMSQSNVTDCNILTTFGIFIGIDAANAPQLGLIGLEQLYFSGGRAQRCLAFSTRQWYYRDYNENSTTWSAWRIMDGSDRLPYTGGTMTGQIKGITPVDVEDLTRKDYVDGLDTTTNDKMDNEYVKSIADGGGIVGADRISSIVSCTQAEYAAGSSDISTLYIIVG